jgi:hypothetical protein
VANRLQTDRADVLALEAAADLGEPGQHLLALFRTDRRNHDAAAGQLVDEGARQAVEGSPDDNAVERPLARQPV